jgi:cytochrome b involved in lipid metabolism
MALLYKILRITAWLLVLATILSLFTGYLAVKYFLLTGIDYRSVHVNVVPWVFIPLFYLHSAAGFVTLLTRHKSTNKKSLKIIVQIAWLAIFVLLIFVILAKPPAINSTNTVSSSQNKILTSTEVAKHNIANDCWLIISNGVYNITTYLRSHPGGYSMILPYCGKDGTQAFITKDIGRNHSNYAYNLLNDFYIGNVGGVIK